MYPEQFVEFLKVEKAAAILRTSKADIAALCMEAAVKGGFRVVEFTLTTPGALELIQEFARRKDLAVGAGTVLSLSDARRSVEAGACFLASPVLDARIVAEARAMNVAMIPGTHTATEMWQAYQLGASLQKLFPAAAGGPAYVKSCLAPMPFLRIVPTNGVDASNAPEYLRAGAYAVGFNNALFPDDFVNTARYDLIQERAGLLLAGCKH
jgi:Entner-Doudoroff aldolase